MTERENEVLRRLANEYCEQNRNITVDIELVPFEQARARFEQGCKSGVVPDILRADRNWIKAFARDDMIQPLTGLEPLKEEKADLLPAAREVVLVGDELLALPQEVDCLALLYNKKHFDEAKLAPPEDLDQLREVAAKLTRKESGRFGLMLNPTAWWFEPILFSFGGQYFNAEGKLELRTDQTRKAINYLIELKEKGVLPQVNLREQSYSVMMESFKTGTVSMIMNGPWSINDILNGPAFKGHEDQLGVAKLPKGPRGCYSTIGGQSYVIPRAAAHPREALQLLKHFYKPESLRTMALRTYALPARKSLYDEPNIKNHPILAAYLCQLMENRTPEPHARQIQLYEQLDKFLLRVLNGEVKVDDGLKDVEAAWGR